MFHTGNSQGHLVFGKINPLKGEGETSLREKETKGVYTGKG